MIRIYTASKLSQAGFWHYLDTICPEVFLNARWLKHNRIGTPNDGQHAQVFWAENENDIRASDIVVVYAAKDEHLRGALVEAGIGIALKKPVHLIGTHPDYGTWQFHPQVISHDSVEDFIVYIRNAYP